MEWWPLFLVPLLPFLGFLVNGLFSRRLSPLPVSLVGCAAPGIAFVVSVVGFFRLSGAEGALAVNLGPWIAVAGLDVPFGFRFDHLSAVMTLVVTGVGTLIHIYSAGYMKGDPGYARYFAFLNLFTAAMLVLVLADNLVLMFLGWEGVGLCSYLLIGFWYKDITNCAAGIKAFVVNRIGDLGFLLGIFLTFVTFQAVDFSTVNGLVDSVPGEHSSSLFWIALLLFVGATGKSAQIPLYVWLPDAMAGPTPVSALIHAATMVTSGVYMVARLGPLYSAVPEVGAIVATVGAATALLAALIALSQTDIKKVLAYSTVSQLGYMFLAAGVGAYSIAIFHLVTHSFFKAVLFLGAGGVIHSLHHEQDMRRMGGLAKKIPHTFWTFTAGALALAGFPLTAGFFSKDEILHASEHTGFWPLFAVGLVTAVLTAFYIFRQVYLVFFGDYRGEPAEDADSGGAHGHGPPRYQEIHESPLTMRLPLYILGALSLVGGLLLLGLPQWVSFVGEEKHLLEELHEATGPKVVGWLVGGFAAIAGITAALYLYTKGRAHLQRWTEEKKLGRELARMSLGKFYVDELYDRVVVKPLFVLAEVAFWVVDRALIDFVMVTGAGGATRGLGKLFRRLQTGRVPSYAVWFLCGVVGILALSLWILK